MAEPVYVVDGARTPFLKARNRPGPFATSDLAVQAGRALLLRQRFAGQDLDEVILGCASPRPTRSTSPRDGAAHGVREEGARLDRDAQLRVGYAGARFCDREHRCGRSHLVLAGGVDALPRRCSIRRKWCCGSQDSAPQEPRRQGGRVLSLNPAAALTRSSAS
jgi:acetyl-CoA C-acetyltransferase